MDFNKCKFGFIGLGLIGGSIAKAIREKYRRAVLIAYAPHPETVQSAVADGVVNIQADAVDGSFSGCDVIFLCAPVEYNVRNMERLQPYLSSNTILTDVGSTKTDIHRHVREAGLQKQFIGGHPMTGSERIGYRNSNSRLLENAYYILAPEPEFSQEGIDFMTLLIDGIGALPLVVEPERHDYATAAISHLPHVISASLVNLVRDSDGSDQLLKTIAAGGFKDITRISSSSPEMWEQICMTNAGNILSLLDRYIDSLTLFREQLAQKKADSLYQFFDGARTYRDSFSARSSGPIQPMHVLHVDIADRPGVLAEVVMYLAIAGINIKNIGIEHNREYQEGVLRVECHSSEGLAKAKELLTDRNYKVY